MLDEIDIADNENEQIAQVEIPPKGNN